MTTQVKVAWISAIAVVIAAIIGGIFSISANSNQNDPTSSTIQKVDSGAVNSAGRDINQAGRDNLNAGRDIHQTNIYGDTAKSKDKSVYLSPTVIDKSVKSYNAQPGSITAYNVIVPSDKENEITINTPDNCNINIDTVRKEILVKPKHGKWNIPFLAIDSTEWGSVEPGFRDENGTPFGLSVGKFEIHGPLDDGSEGRMVVVGMRGKIPATRDFGYVMSYKNLPKTIVVGDDSVGNLSIFNIR